LKSLQKHTLAGCHLLFSGVIEHGVDPKTHHCWVRAEAFGAKCYTELTSQVTHIVARRGGTEKIKSAKKENANVYLVHVEWLRQSIFHWKRQNEQEYPVTDYTGITSVTCPVLLGNEPTIISVQEPVDETEQKQESQQPTKIEDVNEEELEKELEKEFDDIIDSDMEREVENEFRDSEDSKSVHSNDEKSYDIDTDNSWDG